MKFTAEKTAKVHVGFIYSGLTSKIFFSTISNVDFNVFEHSNVYSNISLINNKMWSYSFSSQFYSTSITSSSEEETSPVKGRAFKGHMKEKEK